MSITVGSVTFSALTAQPLGYEEKETQRGQTAKKWIVSGLLTPTEWINLLAAYDGWRDLRIEDEDPAKTFVVGTTIEVTGTGPDGATWDVECWFSSAPQGEQAGNMIAASVEVVDAAEALQLIAKEEEEAVEEDTVDLGTVSVGSGTNIGVIKLLRPMDTYGDTPSLQLTASGKYYVSGAQTVRRIRDIEGTTTQADWTKIQAWYESEIVKTPTTGTWYPISVPTIQEATNKLVDNVKTIQYTVTIQLAYII